jgi:hypothetical protein
MSTHAEPGTEHAPVPVKGLPGGPWYRTLDEAIHAWAIKNELHEDQEVPPIRVYLHSHVGGWSVG